MIKGDQAAWDCQLAAYRHDECFFTWELGKRKITWVERNALWRSCSFEQSFTTRKGLMDGWFPHLEDLAFMHFLFFLQICALIDKSGWKSLAEFTGMKRGTLRVDFRWALFSPCFHIICVWRRHTSFYRRRVMLERSNADGIRKCSCPFRQEAYRL